MRTLLRKASAYLLYPFYLATVLTIITLAIRHHWDYSKTYGLTTLGLVLSFIILEYLIPLERKWRMTWKSFLRDLKYIAVDAPLIAIVKSGFGLLAIYYSSHHQGLFSKTPLVPAVIGFLLVFDFFQYWYHRWSHTGKGSLGKFLWEVHLAHHLPDRVYVVMHAVFNPINAVITATLLQTPLVLLGISPEAVLAATLLIDLQTIIGHFNVEIRAGFLNYIFIGTETHRYHHSANPEEAKNFGSVLAIWDILFGTFLYKPGKVPRHLGVDGQGAYPASNNLWKVVTYPFVRKIPV